MNKETFCPYPFDTIFLGADSGIKTCCSARTDIGNLNTTDIETILQSDVAQSVRDSILNGKWHTQCSQCKEIEDLGGRSERSTAVENSYDHYNSLTLDKTYFKLEKIDLRWSNTCNLACNYCYEYFSSKWSNIKGIKVNTLNELNENSLFLYIEKHKDSIKDINLLGGEPLLQKQNSKLVDILFDKHYYVLTNLAISLENNKIADKLLAAPDVSWGVSFETINDRYEYVRHGATWKQFSENIKYLKTHHPTVKLNAHPLYCTYSAFNLVEYYDYVKNEDAFSEIYWCLIQNIDGLNILKLPKNLQEKAVLEIDKCEQLFKEDKSITDLRNIKEKLILSLDDKLMFTSDRFKQFNNDTEKLLVGKEYLFKDLWPDLYREFYG